jgi:hypothetical protein
MNTEKIEGRKKYKLAYEWGTWRAISFFPLLSVSTGMNPWFQISGTKKIAASAPSQGVELEWKRSAALHGGATGGG